MAGPRLLDKKIVQASLAQERKIEIDKGVKLAKAIDILRETKAKEEKDLEEFRIVTTQKVQAEIDALLQECNRLRQEVGELLALRNDYGRS